jgi:tetratricopeptide (TPR) repeat protein
LSKVNAIRKKALDHVRRQDWQNAIKEYKRLADLDQSNPNVFNELGDIYLKTGNKNDAYDAFSRAIDSYTRVSLHNNAVAVCKKVLRLIPARYEVLTKLGLIRKKQGLGKEAESYYLSYLDKLLADQQIGPSEVNKSCAEITEEMEDSASVLAKTYDCLVKFNLKGETGDVLQKLHKAYCEAGDEQGKQETRQQLQELGVAADEPESVPVAEPDQDRVVITEENIWSAQHSEGERIEVDDKDVEPHESVPAASSDDRADSVYEYGELEMEAAEEATQSEGVATSTQTLMGPEADAADADTDTVPEEKVYDITEDVEAESPAAAEPQAEAAGESEPADAADQPPPAAEPAPATSAPATPGGVHVSAIIGDEGGVDGDEMTEDDYRSHYDLGMAYLEMDLMAEAIRELQLASKSEAYQSRALEMIGLCFLKQNQPGLAIKQLTKGLQMIGDNDTEALGIKYNLGLAYEMTGDIEKARNAFEDVYVEDVTFRDVAEKIQKYS